MRLARRSVIRHREAALAVREMDKRSMDCFRLRFAVAMTVVSNLRTML